MSPVPQRLGRWEVLSAIAQGGQGAVLRARDGETGQPVALKLLLRADGKALRRFRQEAQVLERLAHPGIVRVLGSGDEGGVPWLAMELIEGETLKGRVEREGPLPPLEAARLVAEMARAVAHAHEHGVVHRDLKPENVIIERATGRAVLVDFGLLRRDSEVFGELSIDAQSRLSKTGELRGTPAYMAPEQVSPTRFGGIGPGTDVYGLGGVLFFLLTGKPPHEAEGLPGLIYQILESTVSPDPSVARPALPRSIVAEVRRALAPAPSERHPSAAALAEALDLAAGGGGATRPARTVFLAGLALSTLVAAAGVAIGVWWIRREGEPPPAASSPTPGATLAAAAAAAAHKEEVRLRDAARDLASVGSGSAAERLVRASAWLDRYGGLAGEAHAREVLRLAGHEAPIVEVHPPVDPGAPAKEARALWLDDGRRFVSWGRNHGFVRLWSEALDAGSAGRCLRSWNLGSAGITDVAIVGTANDALIAVGPVRGVWRVDLAVDGAPRRLAVDLPRASAVARAPGGRMLLGDSSGALLLLDGPDDSPGGTQRRLAPAHASPIQVARFSADGRWVATTSGRFAEDLEKADNRVVVWDAATLEPVGSHELLANPVSLAFSSDSRWLAVGTSGYRAHVIDLRAPAAEPRELIGERSSGQVSIVLRPMAHGGSVRGLAFLPDGTLRSGSGENASTGAENGLRGWDPATGKELVDRMLARPSGVLSLDATHDGRLLVGEASGTITVWSPW